MAAELAHNAVPREAAAKVGRDVKARAVGPTERKPNAVVDTTSADRRALDSSARCERCEFLLLLDCDVSLEASVLVARTSDADLVLHRCKLFFSSDVVVENERLPK